MKFQRKYFYNDNYFEHIDSEEKAYWLGFLYADGHIDDNSCECELKESDKDHLTKFLNAINANEVPLHYRANVKEYRFSLHSKKFIKYLQNLGFTHNKTYDNTDIVFKNIPDNYKRDFIRGYWDGDGCIGSYKKQRNYTEVISLNKKLLESFVQYFNQYFCDPYFSKVIITNNKYYRICLGSIKAYKLCNFLYKNSNIYLERKYKKYLELVPSNKNYYNIRQKPSGRYQAYIKINYIQQNLGTYNTIKEAVEAYNKKAIEIGRNPQPYVGESLFMLEDQE